MSMRAIHRDGAGTGRGDGKMGGSNLRGGKLHGKRLGEKDRANNRQQADDPKQDERLLLGRRLAGLVGLWDDDGRGWLFGGGGRVRSDGHLSIGEFDQLTGLERKMIL
jgi:hypothetical protein